MFRPDERQAAPPSRPAGLRPADAAEEWEGSTVVACSAPLGSGGLGRHLAEIAEVARRYGDRLLCLAGGAGPGEEDATATVLRQRWPSRLFRYTPLRFSPGWKSHLAGDWFDAAVARRLPGGFRRFIGFNGQALRTFRRARESGFEQLGLVAATPHVSHVRERDRVAIRRYPFESPWLNGAQVRKTLAEYEQAQVIFVGSTYSAASLCQRGVALDKLRLMAYTPHPRFRPPTGTPPPDDGVFRIVYCGSVTVTKGIPILLEAFARLGPRPAELHLVGGTQTRGMRRYVSGWMKRDPRVRVSPGDPLPALHRADVYVHPSFQDGFGYAPVEALACGVPVIVTADTGMKDHVREGLNGYVVPTGDVEALVERIEHVIRHPLRGRFQPFSPPPPNSDRPARAGGHA